MKNFQGVEIPQEIKGLGKLTPFENIRFRGTADEIQGLKQVGDSAKTKVIENIKESIIKSGLKDGMTISFHHHFRNGDYIINMVMEEISNLGIKNLTLAASSLIDIHTPLIEHIKNGVVTKIETSGIRGDLATAISDGLMETPVKFRSHGGRAYAIATGEIHIDVAFLGSPASDVYGNSRGYGEAGKPCAACGSLGYARVDAQYADKTVIITDNIVSFPNLPCSIPQTNVDYVVVVDAIGDPKGIASGATRFTTNPRELLIAETAANVMEASGYFKEGFSFQTGTGGAALAVTRFLEDKMIKQGITAEFALGGITGQIVKLHENGLVRKIMDVQSFDLGAVESIAKNPMHQEVDGHYYAGCGTEGAAVDQLDMVILSALEVDTDFNVNVLTGSDGVIRGAIGGHQDTAAGAKMSIIVAPLIRGRMPTILDRVNTIVTPGCTVDVIVTDMGVAVNPQRVDLIEKLSNRGINLFTINELKDKAEKIVGKPEPIEYDTSKIVGVATYRDGSIIDIIYKVKN